MRICKRRKIVTLVLSVLFAICLLTSVSGVVLAKANGKQAESKAKSCADMFVGVSDAQISDTTSVPAYFGVEDDGVGITFRSNQATAAFANPIDVSKLKSETNLISFYVTPGTKGISDFEELHVRVSDYYDSENYFDVRFVPHPGDVRYGYGIAVKTKDVEYRAAANGALSNTYGGKYIINGLFAGLYDRATFSATDTPVTLSYDNDSKCVYLLERGATERTVLLNMASAVQMGKGNEWKGFSGQLANVTITAAALKTSDASIVVSEFMDMELGSNYLGDRVAPTLYTEADECPQMLQAVVGREYKLFDSKAYDIVDGVLSDEVVVSVKDENGEAVEISNGAIVPTSTGKYQVLYTITDEAGNATQKSYDLYVRMTPEEMTLDVDGAAVVREMTVGKEYDIPQASVSGGVGEPVIETYVVNTASGTEEEVVDGKYTPSYAGNFQIEYRATDYIGTKKVFVEKFSVIRGNAPIGEFPVLPENVIAGQKYKLPEMEAYDYVSDKTGRQNAKIRITGSYEGSSTYFKVENYEFTPTLPDGVGKAVLHITYTAECVEHVEGVTEKLTHVYDVNVARVEKMSDFLIASNGYIAPSSNKNKSYVEYDLSKNASLSYINPLATNNFNLQFIVPSKLTGLDANNGLKSIKVTITDIFNERQRISFAISQSGTAGKSRFVFQNEDYEMEGAFLTDDELLVKMDVKNKTLTGKTERIAGIFTYDNGEVFKGFSSNRVYVQIDFETQGDGVVRVQRVGSQAFGTNFDRNNNEIPYADRVAPIIIVDGEIQTIDKKYDKVTVYTAHAYDAIDSYVACYVSVRYKPTVGGWKTIVEKTLITDEELHFYIEDYGRYYINYTAEDSSGNECELSASIRVLDVEPPVFEIDGEMPTTGSTNKKITLPNTKCYDRNDTTKMKVFLVYNGVINEITEDMSFTPTKKGNYIVRYYVYDTDYNVTYKDYTIVVK